MKELRLIITTFIDPPIPDRSKDWCAYRDGEEEKGNYGYGATEAAAIHNLLEIEADEE